MATTVKSLGVHIPYTKVSKTENKKKTPAELINEYTIKKEDSVIDRLLTDPDNVDGEKEAEVVKELTMKIARGEKLTEKERKLMNERYPDAVMKAKMARSQAEMVKTRLKNAKTKQERDSIVMQAYDMVGNVYKKDKAYGEVLGEAMKKALAEAKEEKEGKLKNTLDKQDMLYESFQGKKAAFSLFDKKY